MEKPKQRMKQTKKDEREGFDKRSPLRNLHHNRIQFLKSRSKKCSNISSSSHSAATSVSVEAPNASPTSLASSSSTTASRVTNNVSATSSSVSVKVKPRSKGNELPKKSFSEQSKKTAQRSNLRSGKVAISKKGFEEMGEDTKNSNGLSIETISDGTKRFTPVGKMSDSMSFEFCKNARHDSVSTTGDDASATSVKTPPVEVSVSPEIQRVSHSKMASAKSSATPVCYGAGHLLSGVSDKRKCRRRGSLRGGIEKVNLFGDEKIDSSIPLLAEASVRWRLSPCEEAEIRQEECKMINGNASLAFDLMSSPLTFCGNVSELGCENNNYSGSDSLLDDSKFKGFLAHSDEGIDSLLAVNPNSSTSNCDNVSVGDGNVRHNVIEYSSAFSVGSLSSGNIIQTPNSDSSSDENVGWSKVDAQHESVVQFEIDSITETLNAVSMSPRSEMSDSIFPIQLQENVDSVCSWVSDSTLEGLSLSQVKISWRDGLVYKVHENEDFDCTRCLSDEQNDEVECSGKQIMSYQLSESEGDEESDLGVNSCLRSHLGIEFKENEDNAAKMNLDSSPILLEYEPCISARGKEKLSEDRLSACAESICTNGGDLAASCDSDCT